MSASDYFSDEIAIDFPSVDALVERVRDAFLGELPDANTVMTEVSLSSGEAFRGAVVPLEDLNRFGVAQADIASAQNTPAFCEMMRFEVKRTRDWFQQGLSLVAQVKRELAIDIELFSRGGLEILNAIERQKYKVLGRRPTISKTRKLALLARAALGKLQ